MSRKSLFMASFDQTSDKSTEAATIDEATLVYDSLEFSYQNVSKDGTNIFPANNFFNPKRYIISNFGYF